MKTWPILALGAFLLAGCGGAHDPKAGEAWVRLAAVPGQPAAGYFTLHGAAGDTLVQVESALATRVELHESMKGMSGMMSMQPLKQVAVPADGELRFAPGGHHLMIYGLDKVIQPGTAVPLRFGFASGKTAEAEAKTVAAGDDAPY